MIAHSILNPKRDFSTARLKKRYFNVLLVYLHPDVGLATFLCPTLQRCCNNRAPTSVMSRTFRRCLCIPKWERHFDIFFASWPFTTQTSQIKIGHNTEQTIKGIISPASHACWFRLRYDPHSEQIPPLSYYLFPPTVRLTPNKNKIKPKLKI